MKKIVRRLMILLFVFLGGLIVFSVQGNKGKPTLAAPVMGPSLPLAYMQVEGTRVNPMTPYRQELREAAERECLTPLSVDRSLQLVIDPMENSIRQVGYQVTSLEDGHLLENGEIVSLTDSAGLLSASFALQTTEIRNEQEYMLRFTVELGDGSEVYYYTRVIQYGSGNIASYLTFANNFIESATDKVLASDLNIYMEPDDAEANRSLAHITIKSSTDLLSWSALAPTIVRRLPPTITEINDINAGIRQQYVVKAVDSDLNEEFYTVEEFFRITEYAGGLIVRNYQRDVAQIFDPSLPIVGESAVNLGIQQRNIPFVENADSTRAAFVVNGELWSYDAMNDKVTRIFSFRGKTQGEIPQPDLDLRTEFARHNISIGQISNSGDVMFVVYGYMPSGAHEGMLGVSVCNYVAEDNTVEERMFLPLSQSLALLDRNVQRLSFADGGDSLYLYLGTDLCRINLRDGSYSVEEEGIQDAALLVSASQKLVAWTDAAAGEPGSKLTVRNLASGKKRAIEAPRGQKITACGFVGEDLAYGLVREEDIFYLPDGSVVGGMYTIRIEDPEGQLRKEYTREGIYVTDAQATDVSLQLELAVRTEEGLIAAGTDQIRNNELKEDRVQLVPISNARTEEQIWLTFSGILLQTDPDILSAVRADASGGVETVIEWPQPERAQYYIYGYGDLQDIETDLNAAVQKAWNCSGAVLDEAQRCLWQRGAWPVSYQIELDELPSTLLAAGVSGDLTAFEKAIGRDRALVDLSGTETTGMFYPISRGYPVFARMPDGSSQLLVGYTEEDIRCFDAATGGVKEITRKNADSQFQKAGYVFYTYREKLPDELSEETQEES